MVLHLQLTPSNPPVALCRLLPAWCLLFKAHFNNVLHPEHICRFSETFCAAKWSLTLRDRWTRKVNNDFFVFKVPEASGRTASLFIWDTMKSVNRMWNRGVVVLLWKTQRLYCDTTHQMLNITDIRQTEIRKAMQPVPLSAGPTTGQKAEDFKMQYLTLNHKLYISLENFFLPNAPIYFSSTRKCYSSFPQRHHDTLNQCPAFREVIRFSTLWKY